MDLQDSVAAPGETFDIQAVAQRIFAAGSSVVEVETLAPGSVLPEGKGVVVLVKGDMVAGASLSGAGSVVVSGSVIGRPDGGCRIDVEGDVAVLGSVRQAEVKGCRIYVGKGASKSVLTTETELRVGGDMVDVRVFSGGAGYRQQAIETLQKKMAQRRRERDSLAQQARLEERLTDKLFQATRISFDFKVGEIVQRKRNRLKIDLEPFYRVVGDKSEEDVDRALREFFSKAVVGLLTRVNQPYIQQGVNNRKIFTTSVRKLYDLIFLKRRLDRQTRSLQREEAERQRLAEALACGNSRVFVGGALLPAVEMAFTLPQVEAGEDGCFSVACRSASALLRDGTSGSERQIVRVNASGEDDVQTLSAGALAAMLFYVENGTVNWEFQERVAS